MTNINLWHPHVVQARKQSFLLINCSNQYLTEIFKSKKKIIPAKKKLNDTSK